MHQTPRGTLDILPDSVHIWQFIEKTARAMFACYNYKEIKTPIFESTDLFTTGIGTDTDIVSKEMYTFLDRKNRSLTLRPEGTAPIARAYIQHALHKKASHHQLYYVGPMFRYERPQSGRYRQFTQIGVENIGSDHAFCDAEVIMMGVQLFKKLGLNQIKTQVNTIGCRICRPVISERLRQFLESNLKSLCSNCQIRFKTNPLRIVDCKKASCQHYFSGMPNIRDSICQSCRDHFDQVLMYLDTNNIDFELNANLVRGLDYYNGTTFEIISDALGSQNALCGGGRYDTLIKRLGGPNQPAVGFAFGVERVMALLNPSESQAMSVYVGFTSRTDDEEAFFIVQQLRYYDIKTLVSVAALSENSHLKRAEKQGCDIKLVVYDANQVRLFQTGCETVSLSVNTSLSTVINRVQGAHPTRYTP